MTHPEQDQRRSRGIAGEQAARDFLESRGMNCLDAGWRCRLGEIDLVMRDRDELVFVEVRARRDHGMVGALESIDAGKQRRFVRAARAWLGFHPRQAELPARFDIVAIDGDRVDWVRDAFSVSAW